jgi:alkyl sulfatase BDS1-like metallo-beta-lactamase superfamily hydrolase
MYEADQFDFRGGVMLKRILVVSTFLLAACQAAPVAAGQQAVALPPNPQLPSSMDFGDPTQNLSVIKVAPSLFYVMGKNVSSNTIVLETPAGAVVIDTSRPPASKAHFDLLQKSGVTKAAYVILTHGHGDHTGGVALWKSLGAKVVAQEEFSEFLGYQRMLAGFFARRNAAQFQFAGSVGAVAPSGQPGVQAAAATINAPTIVPDLTFRDALDLDVGGVKLQLLHTPGETPDHLTVWVPSIKAAMVGDNFYESFPNMYTLRGTRPRWPMDYINSLETVLKLEPEIVIPSHGPAIVGKANIKAQLTKMHDAIVYVHDAVLKGMNAGKDVHTLMREIELPPALDVGEGYGKISWSVRGIYESYAGWFGGDPAEMFPEGRDSISPDLMKLAGGPKAIANEAMKMVGEGKLVEALQMTSVGIEGAPGDKDVLHARVAAFEALVKASTNRNELGWLNQGLAEAKRGLQ